MLLTVLAVSTLPGQAGVTVVENVSPGAKSWPGSPLITTLSNPTNQATVPESFNSANTSIGQTFKVTTTNYTLQTIDIYAGSGNGGTITLNFYDLGSQSAPNPSSYAGSANLLGSGSGLSASYINQAYGILEFDFTGSDQVILQAGHMYAFELAGTQGTTPVYWMRAGSDTYSSGTAYRNQSYINGVTNRDFALAVYGTVTSQSAQSGQCTVNWTNVYQKIDGFGGGVVFLNPTSLEPVTDANMNTLFGSANASQLGLSILRVRIAPDNDWSDALSDAKKAKALGASILATPWTPPASMKSNNDVVGGSLLAAQYANYAAYLNNFAASMATNKTPLAAISVQNEPDITVTYESCSWTATQLKNFFRTNAAAITNAPVMMPESYQFDFDLSDSTLNDAIAVTNVDLIGGHLYGTGTVQAYTNALNRGKPTWMTEYLVNDQTWTAALATAQQLHGCLAVGNMSAYIWWKCLGDANGLVNASGTPQKRGFAIAQFSRFVRPGYYRVGVTNVAGNISMSAYKDSGSGKFAIVAINVNLTTVTQVVNLANFTADSVTPWITSSSLSLSSQSAVPVTNASFIYPLPAMSVVTFVGQAWSVSTNIVISSATCKNQAFVLTWNATPGAIYSVLRTNGLAGAAANWPAVITGYPPGGAPAGSLSYTDTTATASQYFYRVTSP
jgi:glucuronoarabinoxylan endo-1,4-beta-xylanase